MSSNMSVKASLFTKPFVTNITRKRFLPCMCFLVSLKISILRKRFLEILQEYGFSPICVLIWLFSDRANFTVQISQEKEITVNFDLSSVIEIITLCFPSRLKFNSLKLKVFVSALYYYYRRRPLGDWLTHRRTTNLIEDRSSYKYPMVHLCLPWFSAPTCL